MRATPAAELGQPLTLAVLSVTKTAVRCCLPGTDDRVTVRTTAAMDVVPGEILVIRPDKQWIHAGHLHVSGAPLSARIDAAALRITPLRLEYHYMWNPAEEYWGEEGEPIAGWARPIIERGPRPALEMEQVIPGSDPDDLTDPVVEAAELTAAGDGARARRLLLNLCEQDIRCLDAHAHLGNLVFDRRPALAIRHYEAGVRIGELSLDAGFDGLLPWSCIDNRPFLRCLHGFGLCLWRLGSAAAALAVFERMLWLNPSDNQGARILLQDLRAKRRWEQRSES
jgi:hypothetical protein